MRLKNFKETTSLAWSAIKASPLRTILTSLIISFGIMALVGILSATDALKQSLESNFTSLGANTLTIRNSQGNFFWEMPITDKTLKLPTAKRCALKSVWIILGQKHP